jgi:hypothetical protein
MIKREFGRQVKSRVSYVTCKHKENSLAKEGGSVRASRRRQGMKDWDQIMKSLKL